MVSAWNRRPRVLVLGLEESGLGRYALCLGKGLSNWVRARMLLAETLLDDPLIQEYLEGQDVRLITGSAARSPVRRFSALRSILREATAFEPDVIHDAIGHRNNRLLPIWPLLSRRYPVIMTVHDPRPHTGHADLRGRWLSGFHRRMADRFVIHGPFCKMQLVSLGVDSDLIDTQPMGAFDFLASGSEPVSTPEGNSVLFFGPMRPNKGVQSLPEIVRRVRLEAPQTRFIVAGDPRPFVQPRIRRRWYGTVDEVLAELGRLPGVELQPRRLSDREVRHLFSRAAVVILPYTDATQTAVAPIAGLFSRPVVATNVGDVGVAVLDGKTGTLTRPGDLEAFSRAVSQLVKEPARAREMGANARRLYTTERSWAQITSSLVPVYRGLLASNPLR